MDGSKRATVKEKYQSFSVVVGDLMTLFKQDDFSSMNQTQKKTFYGDTSGERNVRETNRRSAETGPIETLAKVSSNSQLTPAARRIATGERDASASWSA
jgi:hypothetical protein